MGKKKKQKDKQGDVIVVNKKASFQYHLSDRIEGGLVLLGSEVKSLREKKANLTDSYATIIDGEVWLVSCHISEYKFANLLNHEPRRKRKVLLHNKEIAKLVGSLKEKGLTLVPTKLYFKKGKAKVELALGKGKKLFDKRDTIKDRENKRKLDRAIKSR